MSVFISQYKNAITYSLSYLHCMYESPTNTHTHTHTHTHTQTYTGHRTYMAYIYMEYSYNNMIMRHFSHLLLETLHKRRSQHRVQQRIPATLQQRLVDGEVSLRTHSTMTNTSNGILFSDCLLGVLSLILSLGFNNDLYMCSHRARLRWHLAFTLLRNQSLCQDRVHSHHYNTSTATVDYGATATLDTCKTNHTHFEEWS